MYSLSAINVVSQKSVSSFVNVLWILPSCFPSRERMVDTVRKREDGMNWESNYLPVKNFKSVFILPFWINVMHFTPILTLFLMTMIYFIHLQHIRICHSGYFLFLFFIFWKRFPLLSTMNEYLCLCNWWLTPHRQLISNS